MGAKGREVLDSQPAYRAPLTVHPGDSLGSHNDMI